MLRSYINKYYHNDAKFPIKMWQSAEINGEPHAAIYDGAVLKLVNLTTKKVLKSIEYHQINAFSESMFVNCRLFKYRQVFFFAFRQRFIKVFDDSLNEITQMNFDCGMAIIAMHWDVETSYLYLAGTNGWLKCYHIVIQHRVTDFAADWQLVFSIRSTEDWIVSLAHDTFTNTLYGIANTTLYAWELGTGVFKFRLPDLHDKFKLCEVFVIPESHLVATSALDGTIKLWNVQISVCKLYWTVPSFSLGYLSFDVRERFIMTNGSDRTIRLFRIGNETPIAQYCLASKTEKKKIDDVVIVGIQTIPINYGKDGYYCVTSFQKSFDCVVIGFAPDDFITSSYPINYMVYVKGKKELMCVCENNLVITQSKTYDLDMITDKNAKRSPASDTTALSSTNNILITGHKNGAMKYIDSETMEGVMIENVELDDSILCITCVKGMFNKNHPLCGIHQVETNSDQEYIISFSKSGSIHVCCAKCLTSLIDQKLNRKNVNGLKIIESKSMIFISFDKTLAAYHSNGYSFNFVGQISTSGNQTVETFDVDDNLTIIIGTSSGEIIIADMEKDDSEYGKEYNIIVKHHMVPTTAPALRFNICPGTKICACAFSDGLIYVFEYERIITISSNYYTDADPLSSVLFVYDEEEGLRVYLAFSIHVHLYKLSTEVPEIVEVVEEEKPEEPPRIVEEEEEDIDPNQLMTFFTQPETTTDISKLFKEETKKKKRPLFIEQQATRDKSIIIEPLPPPKPQLTLEQVIEKNEAKVQQILGEKHANIQKKKPASRSGKRPTEKRAKTALVTSRALPQQKENVQQQQQQQGFDLTLTNFSYKSVQKPVSMSELKQTLGISETVSTRGLSRAQVIQMQQEKERPHTALVTRATPQKVYFNSESNSELEATIAEGEDFMYRTEPGTWMMQKTKKPYVTTTPIATLKKTFIAPPLSSRILFDDETTLNSLSFYDPRGFSAKFETEEEKQRRLDAEAAKKAEEQAAKELARSAKLQRPKKVVKMPETHPQMSWTFSKPRTFYKMKERQSITVSIHNDLNYSFLKRSISSSIPPPTHIEPKIPLLNIPKNLSHSLPQLEPYPPEPIPPRAHLLPVIETEEEQEEKITRPERKRPPLIITTEKPKQPKAIAKPVKNNIKPQKSQTSVQESSKHVQHPHQSPHLQASTHQQKHEHEISHETDEYSYTLDDSHNDKKLQNTINNVNSKSLAQVSNAPLSATSSMSTLIKNSSQVTFDPSQLLQPTILNANLPKRKRQQKESQFTNKVHKAKMPEQKVFKDKKIKITKKESDLAKLKGNKVVDIHAGQVKRYNAKDINAAVKAAMHSTKPAPSVKRPPLDTSSSSSKKSSKPSTARSEASHSATPRENQAQEQAKDAAKRGTPLKSNNAIPSLRKSHRWVNDNMDSLVFGEAGEPSLSSRDNTFIISDYLPNLSPLWEQKHMQADLPIQGIQTKAPKKFCINSYQLDNEFPDVTLKMFVNTNFLEDFERIFDYECGLDEKEEIDTRDTGLQSYRKRPRRISF